MKKIVSLAIIMLLMTSISFGYTLTINSSKGTVTREVEAGKMVKVTSSDRLPAKYMINDGNTLLNVTGNRTEFVMPEKNVDISIMRPGDYIEYQPSVTSYTVKGDRSGYTSDQTFNPSSITSWKFFKNAGDHIEIISADSVGKLILQGKTGYIYAIDTLNNLCNAYVNPAYATSGRCLGYGNGVAIFDEEKYPMTWEETYVNGNNGFPYTDTGYIDDAAIIKTEVDGKYPLKSGAHHVWLASRALYFSDRGSFFWLMHMHTYGSYFITSCPYGVNSDGSIESSPQSLGVNPVISLNSGIRITGGNGTIESPWQISM